jgi:hypothetical protein
MPLARAGDLMGFAALYPSYGIPTARKGKKKDCQSRLQPSKCTDQDQAITAREIVMKLEGGCYCGAVRYVAEGEPMLQAQCHCRECQYLTGGSPNMFVAMPPDGFKYTKGAPKQFSRKDLEKPVTREFCAECGTHMVTRPQRPIVVVKVGTLDNPAQITPQIAIYTVDKQPFHHIPEGMPSFERLPQR